MDAEGARTAMSQSLRQKDREKRSRFFQMGTFSGLQSTSLMETGLFLSRMARPIRRERKWIWNF